MKIQIIINPSSGSQKHEEQLQAIVRLLSANHTVDEYYTKASGDAKNAAIKAIENETDLLIVSGGDGTVHEVANAIGDKRSHIPVAILANGTVNDFSKYLEIPEDPYEFVAMVEKGDTLDVDLGIANNTYFVNVAAVGVASEIAHEVDKDTKARFGRMAYYLEGIRKLPDILTESVYLRLSGSGMEYEGEAMLLLISNTRSIGGFAKLAPKANICDGKFDVLLVKKTDFFSIADVFLKSLSGEHTENEDVLYFHTDFLRIETAEGKTVNYDVDGELGGVLPMEFSVLPSGLKVVVNYSRKE